MPRAANVIDPALSADEWREIEGVIPITTSVIEFIARLDRVDLLKVIAVANDSLPFGDPHQFSREDVEMLRNEAKVELQVVARMGGAGSTSTTAKRLVRLAALLESYLPPE